MIIVIAIIAKTIKKAHKEAKQQNILFYVR